jgi:hypothetical protein
MASLLADQRTLADLSSKFDGRIPGNLETEIQFFLVNKIISASKNSFFSAYPFS